MKHPRSSCTAIVLFTRDLRVHDQRGLAEAAQTSDRVAPLFVLDDRMLAALEAPNRIAFLVEALGDLRAGLRQRGGDLVIRRGDPVVETLRLAGETGARTVFLGDDASTYARRRQERLERECRSEGIELRIVDTTTVVPPGCLTPAGADHYRVFTPYWRRWREAPLRSVARAPDRIRLPPGLPRGRIPLIRELTELSPSPGIARGGEKEGRKRLVRWLGDGLHRYDALGDRLDIEATSRLSAYLHFGCISALEVVSRARARPDSEGFVRQLCWRDFFLQLLSANPGSSHADLRSRRDEWRHDDDAFIRWREGRTGYPIVDAAMRQLAREGWLPNRARLIAGSFLTRTLGLDWRLGERTFSELLVDGDVASNVGNWQWVAGTGVDTRRNRVLNPLRQARRFDPAGGYVRRWVPELARLSGPRVHEPWTAAGPLVAPEYPRPIVDLRP
jgi:deoxyribodipyrimidine photo-lyase